MRHPLEMDGYGGNSNLALLVRDAKGELDEWRKRIQVDIEKWCTDNGYKPGQAKDALALIDELKTRGVKSFDGLGIKVTF